MKLYVQDDLLQYGYHTRTFKVSKWDESETDSKSVL